MSNAQFLKRQALHFAHLFFMHGEHCGPAVAERIFRFFTAVTIVKRHGNGAEFENTEVTQNELDAVGRQQCDSIAWFRAACSQPCGHSGRKLVQFTKGPAPIGKGKGRPIGPLAGGIVQKRI